MEFDAEGYLDAELLAAPKKLTGNLFHYTSAEAAIFGILGSGNIRLSPFASTNDLWESRPTYYNLESHEDDADTDPGFELWDQIDRRIRVNSKVACFTQDWDLPDSVMDKDAFRGWGHLSAWAHYGAGHSGVCLQFNKNELVKSLQMSAEEGARVFHGPVRYRVVSHGAGPYGIDVGQVKEFGVDAVAAMHAERHADSIFFQKHQDWASEVEYRLVRTDQSTLPFDLDIKEALVGIVLGDRFPDNRLPALLEMLKRYPSVQIHRAQFHNRRLFCWPFEYANQDAENNPKTDWERARRTGSLSERLEALRSSEMHAAELRLQGEAMTILLRERVHKNMADLAQTLKKWQKTMVEVHEHIDAVPSAQRSRRPGVPGERIHFENGVMAVVNDLPGRVHALVSSSALQVLDKGQIRLHCVVRTENMNDAPNHQTERWRVSREGPIESASVLWDELFKLLRDATLSQQQAFDADRFMTR